MKVAELFAELGFKIEGKDELKGFETSLQNIANAARNAALALKILSRTPVPKALTTMKAVPAPAPGSSAPGAGAVVVAPAVPYGPPAPPPLLPKGPPPVSNSVLQGLKNLGALGLKVLGIATVATAMKKLVSALIDMMKASMQATFAVDKFTSQTGLSRRELKQWERVAEMSDVKGEELQETLKQLQQRSRQIRFTGEGATPFLQMGINAMASPTEMMKQFAQRSKQMDQATAVFWGAQMGISENMVYLLRKNADKLEGLIPNAETTDREHQSIMELNAAWKDLMFTLGLLRDKIMSEIAPALKWVVDRISVWAKLGAMSKDVRGGMFDLATGNPIGASLSLLRAVNSGSGTKVENNVSVTIDGSKSPQETARATARAINRELSDSYYGRSPPYATQ